MLETVDDHLNLRLLAAGLSLWVSLIRVFMGDLERKRTVWTSRGWGETFLVLRAEWQCPVSSSECIIQG